MRRSGWTERQAKGGEHLRRLRRRIRALLVVGAAYPHRDRPFGAQRKVWMARAQGAETGVRVKRGQTTQVYALCRCGKGRILAVAGATSNPRASTLLSTAAGWEVYFSSSTRLRGMFATSTQSPPSLRGGRSEPSAVREKPCRLRSEQAKTLTAVGCFMRRSQNSSEDVRGSR